MLYIKRPLFIKILGIFHHIVEKERSITLEKYNINNKIIFEMVHFESRKIIFSIIKKSKTIEDMCNDLDFPSSSVYEKIRDLEKLTLVYVEKRSISSHGRIIAYYRIRIKGVDIEFNKNEPKIRLLKNPIKTKSRRSTDYLKRYVIEQTDNHLI